MTHGIQQKRLKIVRGSPHRQRLEGCFALVEKMKRKEWRDAPLNALCGIVFVLYLFLWQLEVNMKSTKYTKSIKMTRFSAKYHLQKSVALTSCKLVQVYGAKPFIIVATAPGPFHESPRYSRNPVEI